MKTTMIIAALSAAAFVAGALVSCSPAQQVAPPPVPPVPTGSYTIGASK